jgi:thermostable 8-oxoguanine DNA glycosylase
MLDPDNVTNFNATDAELEELIIFWVLAAGKGGHRAAKIAHEIYLDGLANWYKQPLGYVYMLGEENLATHLKQYGSGCHNQKAHTLDVLSERVWKKTLDLRTCTFDDLETIKGIGRKTSRCFLLHSRPDQQLAGLDTHILKWLKSKGYSVPKATPSSLVKYNKITGYFLEEARKAGKTPAEMDLEIWKSLRTAPKSMTTANTNASCTL